MDTTNKYVFELVVNAYVKLVAVADTNTVDDKGLYGETEFVVYRVTDGSTIKIGHTRMSPMPGCCGIVVSHGTFLSPASRGTGLSRPFIALKSALAAKLGYSIMLATTRADNVAGCGNFFNSNYRVDRTFINKRTGNLIWIGSKTI